MIVRFSSIERHEVLNDSCRTCAYLQISAAKAQCKVYCGRVDLRSRNKSVAPATRPSSVIAISPHSETVGTEGWGWPFWQVLPFP